MRKLLIGVHDKNCSLRAVTWMMRQFPEVRDLEATLVHVIPDLPAMYWDDGHILTPAEEGERRRVIETWVARQRDYIEPILQGAVHDLIRHGFPQDRVGMKVVVGTGDVADSLLDLAKEGGYQTVVVASLVMLFDPIFQGLAISMMFGAVGATALTLVAVPLLYKELVRPARAPEREDGEDLLESAPAAVSPDDIPGEGGPCASC